jgi:hypothetical protein
MVTAFGFQGWKDPELSSDAIGALTMAYIAPVMMDEVYRRSPIFEKLRSKGKQKIDGGSMRVPFQYREAK